MSDFLIFLISILQTDFYSDSQLICMLSAVSVSAAVKPAYKKSCRKNILQQLFYFAVNYLTMSSSSTSKMRVALGGMRSPAPFSP